MVETHKMECMAIEDLLCDTTLHHREPELSELYKTQGYYQTFLKHLQTYSLKVPTWNYITVLHPR